MRCNSALLHWRPTKSAVHGNQIVLASPLVPVSSSYAISVPITAHTGSTAGSVDDNMGVSMESLLESLSQSVGVALQEELALHTSILN